MLNTSPDLELADAERRLDKADTLLRMGITGRAAFVAGEVQNGIVPVTIALRDSDGVVAFMELSIQAHRWDRQLFCRHLESQSEGATA